MPERLKYRISIFLYFAKNLTGLISQSSDRLLNFQIIILYLTILQIITSCFQNAYLQLIG